MREERIVGAHPKIARFRYGFLGSDCANTDPESFLSGKIVAVGKTFRGHAQENKKILNLQHDK